MAPPLKIKWEYCECGCKSFAVTILGLHFSYYDPLDSKRPYLFAQTHNARSFGRDRSSVQAINKEVQRIVLAHKADIQKELAGMGAK